MQSPYALRGIKNKDDMLRKLTFCFLVLAVANTVAAQGFSGGFKAGLNFNALEGELEANEAFENNIGFHIGATFVYSVTDLFGFKAELMYSQKGAQYEYEGPSYFTFFLEETKIPVYATGTRKSDIGISNSYMDIPVMMFYRIGKLELEAGVNAGVLIGSRGSGGITFSGTTSAGLPIATFTTGVDHNYYSDERGIAAIITADRFAYNGVVTAFLPTSLNAYYESPDNSDNKFKTIDLGLNAGLAFYVNKGLYIGVRGNYGLTDITNTNQDISPLALGQGNTYQTRERKHRNISVQASVGFRF